MPNIKVEPTIPNYPPQGIQAQLDLLYLWNPDVANGLIDQINEALEEVGKDLDNYLTKAEAAATYATQTEVTQLSAALEEVEVKVSSVYRFRGSVATYNNLPTEGNVQGDVWNVEDTGANYAWDGTKWDKLSETIDLTPYLTKEDAADTYATITTVNGKQNQLNPNQLAAVNSGITAEHVASYDAYAGEISAAQSTADKADNAAEVAQQTANLAGQEAAQALSALAGKVNIAQGAENAGKVMTVGADGNLAPAAAQGAGFPQDSDYAPIQYSLEGTDFSGYGRINLGALSDGVYEFYVKTKYEVDSGFSRHYYHLTVTNGEIVTTKPDTYIMPAPEAGAPGPMPTYTADGWASVDMNSWVWCVGKTGTDLIIDTMGGQLGYPLSFGLYGVTSGETIAYITKIRNTATGELLTPTVTLETEPSQFPSYNIGANVFRPYIQSTDSTTSGQIMLFAEPTISHIFVELNGILYPNATDPSLIQSGIPIGGTVSITGIDDTNDYITFDFKISRTEIVVKGVNANGIFSGTQISFYKNQSNPMSSAIVLTKDGGFGVDTDKNYQSSVIFFGTPTAGVKTVLAVYAADGVNDYVLVQNITPTNDASLPDQTGNAGKFLTTDGTNASWGEVQAAAITTDATLTGTGTTDSPLGVAQSVQDSIDGKVSKSGDTMTGTLNLVADVDNDAFTIGNYRMGLNGAQLDLYYNTTPVFSYNPVSGLQVGSLQKYFGTGPGVLGSNEHQWLNVYTEKLNNGADIAIPTTGGTMALLSDIPDTSNLATKAEVQQEIQNAIGTIETALAEV